MSKTKDEIALEEYGTDFCDLSAGEKANVSRKYKAQGIETRRTASVSVGRDALFVKISKIGNGVKECVMQKGETVQHLLNRAGFAYSADKEKITAMSTGVAVELDTKVISGENYLIALEVKSA